MSQENSGSGDGAYGSSKTYNIPLDHLDYKYIEKCQDAKHMEKIVKTLRLGEEGRFPQLEEFAEKRLEALNPKSRVLRKDKPITNMRDLQQDEAQSILDDMIDFASSVKATEEQLSKTTSMVEDEENLPPVRGAGVTMTTSGNVKSPEETKKNKRVKPREYREWDKVDVDAELEKIDQEETASRQQTAAAASALRDQPTIPSSVDTSGMTDQERALQAEREKDKGNEAFRAKDYEEALLYYTRSVSIVTNVPACNNRAQTYLKLKKWDEAIEDCDTVLSKEPNNLKAYLRRATGYQGKRMFIEAKKDLQKVIQKEPNNKRAKDLVAEVNKSLEQQKVKGRRMVIEETDGSDSESEGDGQKAEVQKGGVAEQSQTVVNGDVSEEAKKKKVPTATLR